MKYIIINQVKNGDCFAEEFYTKEEAIARAKYLWHIMAKSDKNKTSEFYVLKSQNPDEEAEDHFDGDVILDLIKEA